MCLLDDLYMQSIVANRNKFSFDIALSWTSKMSNENAAEMQQPLLNKRLSDDEFLAKVDEIYEAIKEDNVDEVKQIFDSLSKSLINLKG